MERNESQPGSAQYALDLAESLASYREDGIELTLAEITECERALRAYASRGLRRAFGVRVPSLSDLREMVLHAWWLVRGESKQIRYRATRSRQAWAAKVLAHDMAALRQHRPGTKLLFRPENDEVAIVALRHFAGHRARRARAAACAVLLASVVAMGSRDGNSNGHADILDLAAAAREIAGFGPAVPGEMARQTVAPGSRRG